MGYDICNCGDNSLKIIPYCWIWDMVIYMVESNIYLYCKGILVIIIYFILYIFSSPSQER